MDRTALSRATESSDAPTPGYLYMDIARGAASSPNSCRETAQYLIRRLQTKQNHNIKFKCLKVMHKTTESSLTRGQFKREICQDPSAIATIKECLQFRGPPDPARGDEIYARVRTAAKECLDAIYSDSGAGSDQMGGAPSSHNAGLAGGISSSYGQPAYGGGGGGSGIYAGQGGGAGGGGAGAGAGGRKMDGIGNPMFKDPRHGQESKGIGNMTIGDVASAVGETVIGIIKDPLAKNATTRTNHSMPSVTVNYGGNSNRVGNLPGYGGGGGYGGSAGGGYGGSGGYNSNSTYNNSQPPGARELAHSTGGQWTMATNRGPNAVGGENSSYSNGNDSTYYKSREESGGANAFQWAQNQNGSSANRGVPGVGGVGGSWATPAPASRPPEQPSVAAQARAEAHGGAYKPSNLSYSSNAGTAASDGTYERNLIQELCPPGGMRAEPPEDKLAAFAKTVPSLNADLVCPGLLDALEDGQPWVIKAKALCVIETTIHASGEDPNPYTDFFHTCAAEIEPLASHARPAVRDPAKRVLKALGIAIATSGTAHTNRSAPKAAQKAAPAPPLPPPSPVNLLDFGDEDVFKSSPAPAPVSMPAEAPPAAPAHGGGDSLFGGLNVAPPSIAAPPGPPPLPPAVPAHVDIFAAMDLKENGSSAAPDTTSKPTAEQPAPVITGSAFGFISDAAPTPAPTLSKPATAEDSIDSLLSLGDPSQKPTMNMAQIQQMAYQQNMLMIQQQMQQMQMAVAMQQQGLAAQPGVVPMVVPQGGAFLPKAVMSSNVMKTTYIPNMSSFSLKQKEQEKQQKSFDFINDAMKSAK